MSNNLITTVSFRIDRETKRKFVKKAKPFGGTSTVFRELVEAFVEDRTTITPPQPKGIYHVN